jgi:hypothetical protein
MIMLESKKNRMVYYFALFPDVFFLQRKYKIKYDMVFFLIVFNLFIP